MAFDSFAMAAVLAQLQQAAGEARLGKIHQPDKHTVVMRFHGPGGAGKLLLSAHPQQGRIQITESSRENPAKAPLFAMVLRKWLDGAKLTQICQTPGERVAALTLLTRNDIGDPVSCRLIVEIMGKHSNIILVGEDGLIIDGIRRYGSNLSRYRQVLPGQPYLPPPPINKLALAELNEENLAEALFQQPDQPLKEALLRQIGGLSPLFAASCCCNCDLAEEYPCGELGVYQLSRLAEQLTALASRSQQGMFQPTLLYKQGKPVDFAAFPPGQWPEQNCQSYPGISQAIDALYLFQEKEQQFNQKKRDISKLFTHHITRLEKKISLQEQDLRQSEAADSHREAGDLLSAYQYHLQKGQTQVKLPSFANPEQSVTIKLDPALTPQENISRYYRRYSKAKNARVPIEEHLNANRQELEYVQSLQAALNCAEETAELTAIVKEATAEGLLRPEAPAGKGAKPAKATEKEAPLAPREYLSPDGFVILVGRNNKQNDKLTLKTADEQDIWLHTQKIPGSHVIIRCNGRPVPDSTLETAAAAAAWFSDGRSADKIPVDYTLAREVKKPAHAKPGMVIYFKQKTLYVQPKEPEA